MFAVFFQILVDILSYFKTQPTLVDVDVPDGKKFTICGDIHGQFYNFMNVFEHRIMFRQTHDLTMFLLFWSIAEH